MTPKDSPKGVRANLLFIWFLISLALCGCTTLPDYAKPRMGNTMAGHLEGEGIGYRTLTLEDFQASSLEQDLKTHKNSLNAHTRIIIRPTPSSKLRISRTRAFDKIVYWGEFSSLEFEASMLPKYSWWNPRVSKQKTAYVLQHEQIHFALMEIAARRMNREVQQDASLFTVFGASFAEVEELMGQKVAEYIHQIIKGTMAQHTEFDKETSLFHDPVAQQRWYSEVERVLREYTPASRGVP